MSYLILILTILSGNLSFFWFRSTFTGYKYAKFKADVFSIILTISILGSLFYLSLLIGVAFWLFLGILLFIMLIIFLKRKPQKQEFDGDKKWSIMILISSIVFTLHHQKWGGWDAWSIWNLHAKFLYDSTHWQNMFSPILEWTHADYPLLLPAIHAMIWTGLGNITPLATAATALLIFISINTLIYDTIKNYTYVAIIVLLSMILGYDFVNIAASEYADSFVSLTFLITIILLYEKPQHYILFSGIYCGIALSLKNEGLVFFTMVLLYLITTSAFKAKTIFSFLMGSLPFLLIVVGYKYFWAPSNDIIAGQSISTMDRILSPIRYFHIIRFGLETLFTKYYMLLLVIMVSYRFRKTLPREVWIIYFILFAYLAIYLVTPKDLIWHLSTSMKRLFHHLYPSYLYLILVSTDLDKWNVSVEKFYKNLKFS